MFWIERYEQTLSRVMLSGTSKVQGMNSMKGLELYGMSDPSKTHMRVPTFTFNITDADAHTVAKYLWEKHAIAVLAENNGGFYSRTLRTYGKTIAVRASPIHLNTASEVEEFLVALHDSLKQFKQST